MTSVVAERPVNYEPPTSPMNAIGEGATPLMYACQQSRDQEVRSILIKKPSAVRERDRTMKTALHYCAENTSLTCADLIISAAPDLVDARDEDGYTPLHLAVIAGNRQLIKFLLAKNADVNCLDYERHSVVHWATVCGEVEALELVLDAGANPSTPDIHGGYPIHYAAQMCGPNSEMGNDVRFGLAVLRKLLEKGVEVNVRDKDGRQPILWAASADSSSSASCPSGSADAILALVNAGANVEADDKDGLTALHCAASRGHTDCLETLVTLCGAEVDVIDSNGCTALFYSVTLGHADSTQLLLSFGAEPNRQDRKGRTPAHCGAAKGQLETLRILGAHGANLWVRNVRGDYPLHEAVVSGRKDLVRWLLTQRPDAVNSPNNDGRCPLHIAAINNNVEMCKILLDGQALLNPVMRTSKGHLMTPIDAALHRGNRGCAKYLQLHGGVPASKLTDKAARLRGGTQRGAMSETQSEQYTTPEYAATLSLPGGRTSLGTSPLGDHETIRRIDNRTLQAYDSQSSFWQNHSLSTTRSEVYEPVRLNDDVAIRHVERIDAPVICTHHRYDDESSGEERMRRRRRRRRREHYVTHDVEEDSRRRRRGGRSDSADSEVRKRRRKRRDEEEYSDSGSERRTRRRWRGRRHSSDEDDEDDVIRDSNWVKNKKRRGERIKRRSRSKESDDRSDVEYVRVRRTIVKSRKTKRKTVTDEEEEETQVEEESEEVSEEEVEEEIEDSKGENREVTKNTVKAKTETATSSKGKSKPRSKSNKEPSNKAKAESQKSLKKEVSIERDSTKKQPSTSSKKQETEQKAPERNKSRISKKTITKEKSIKKTTEEKDKDAVTKSSRKKVVKTGIKKIESGGTPVVVDKVTEHITVEEKSLDEESGIVQTVVTAEVHQEGSQINVKSDTVEESSKEELEKSSREQSAETGQSVAEEEEDKQKETTSDEISKNEEQNDEMENEKDAESSKIISSEQEVLNESQETVEKSEVGEAEAEGKVEEDGEEKLADEEKLQEEKIDKSDEIESEMKADNGEEPQKDNDADVKPAEAEQEAEEKGDQIKDEDETKIENQEEEDVKTNKAETKAEEENEGDGKDAILEDDKEIAENLEAGDKTKVEEEKEEEKAESQKESSEEKPEEQGDETKATTEKESAETKSGEKEIDESKTEKEKEKMEEDEEKLENEKENDKSEEAEGQSDFDDKARSEQVEGPLTDDEAQELEHDSVTESSPIDKEEPTGIAESGASTARSRNGGDSSVLLDSGFEPSPRRDKSSTTSSKQQTRSARGATRGGRGRGRIPRPCRTDDEQPLTTVSVTQAVQNSMRKYQLERRIFQELLELKRLQIRAGRANEQVLVKRLVDDYHKAGLTVGMRQYDGVYTFRNFEKYLYDQLRLLQSSDRRLIPRLKSSDDLEKLTAALKRARFNSAYLDDVPDNPILCTHGTHRCHHAAHAYTGIPCAAYITKLNHHHVPKSGVTKTGSTSRGFLPRIDSSGSAKGRSSSSVPRSLRYVDPSRPVTLELSHGSDKQVISLPTERLDRNKRYYVTFTIKGGSKDDQKAEGQENATDEKDLRHRHAKSL